MRVEFKPMKYPGLMWAVMQFVSTIALIGEGFALAKGWYGAMVGFALLAAGSLTITHHASDQMKHPPGQAS